jgi:Zn-finger nucleic acid-binding protein
MDRRAGLAHQHLRPNLDARKGDGLMANSGPMACPVDGSTLVMSERQGIEIDYCPTCRGVWLDRGELDKIIERSNLAAPSQPAPSPGGAGPWDTTQHHPGYGHGHHGKPYKRRKSFLEELFD